MKHLLTIILIITLITLATGLSVFASNDIGSFGYRTEQLNLNTLYRLQINNGYDNMIFFQGDPDGGGNINTGGVPSTARGGYRIRYNPETQQYAMLQTQPITYTDLTMQPSYVGQNIATGIRSLYIRTIQAYPLIVLDKSFVGQKLLIPLTLLYNIAPAEFCVRSMGYANPYLLLYTTASLDTNVGCTPIYFKPSISTYSSVLGQRIIADFVFEYEITEPQTIYGFYFQYNAPISFENAPIYNGQGTLDISLIVPEYTDIRSFLTLDQESWLDEYDNIRREELNDAYTGMTSLSDAFYSAPNNALLNSTAYGSIGITSIINTFYGFAPLNFLLLLSVLLALIAFVTRVSVAFGSEIGDLSTHNNKPNIKSNKSDSKSIQRRE